MLYRLFLYKLSAATESASAIGIINAAISKNAESEWKANSAAHLMMPFDIAAVMRRIEAEFTDPAAQTSKCRVRTQYPPRQCDQIGFIYVATSYKTAREALPRLHAIAAENGLVLYDAETGKSFWMDLIDDAFITFRDCQQAFHNAILKLMKPVWHIRRLEFCSDKRDKNCSYVVTVKKVPNTSFLERTVCFYKCLSANLSDGEELICDNQCFTIKGRRYSITYVLEGYKKHANQIGYIDKSVPCVELIKIMGTDEAYRWLKTCSDIEKDDIFQRLNFREMQEAYPNPAQRFVASVNITKWQSKQTFSIRYSGRGYYGSEILFHVVADGYYEDGDSISVLKIEEESASFILPFIADIYPDFYERYYMAGNYLPSEMWERILSRLKEAKDMILYDTFNTALEPYIEQFNLFVLAERNDPDYWDKINRDNTRFLLENRYKVAYLYDVFIRWSEAQLVFHCRCCDERMFNIQGP